MEEKKYKMVELIDKLEEVKYTYKILKENCVKLKIKRKLFKQLEKKQNRLKEQEEKYFKLCKSLTNTNDKKECLKK